MSWSISGKTVLVTGATSGLGLEASVTLARMGAQVVLVGRDRLKGEAALGTVRRRSGSDAVTLMRCDFASMTQVRALAADVIAAHPKLDVLVNNAGTVHANREVTEEGVERTFAVIDCVRIGGACHLTVCRSSQPCMSSSGCGSSRAAKPSTWSRSSVLSGQPSTERRLERPTVPPCGRHE